MTAFGKPRIVVTGADLAPAAIAILEDFELVYAGKTPNEAQLIDLCSKTQPVAIIVRYGAISARIMDASKRLRVVSKHGAGIDTIDVEAARARGIAVKAAAGANAPAVAEHTLALILACAKSVVTLDQRMRAGHWDKATHKSLELGGRTLGLVGLGAIGSRVAKLAAAIGMSVQAVDPFASSAPEGCNLVDLDTVLYRSDVVSLHCPLTPENRGMIAAPTIACMKDGVIIINTARGGLIDEAALIAALRSGKVRAAGLDSFQNEPVTGAHKFVDVPNVVLSPHIGGVSTDAYIAMGIGAARNILAVLNEAKSSEQE